VFFLGAWNFYIDCRLPSPDCSHSSLQLSPRELFSAAHCLPLCCSRSLSLINHPLGHPRTTVLPLRSAISSLSTSRKREILGTIALPLEGPISTSTSIDPAFPPTRLIIERFDRDSLHNPGRRNACRQLPLHFPHISHPGPNR
jgi:hypothetical protein